METLSLFQELADPKTALKAAVAADVEAAGGIKVVAALLWPETELTKAIQKLSNACNRKQKQELDYHEIQIVKLAARKASGASHVHAYESKTLNVDLHWVTKQEKAERTAIRLVDAAKTLERAVIAAQEALKEIQ
jgi:hypothetical protein